MWCGVPRHDEGTGLGPPCVPNPRSRQVQDLLGRVDVEAARASRWVSPREAYLKLAENLDCFLARLGSNAATATVPEQQRVLRLLVEDVLIGRERITIRHSIPTGGTATPPPNITDRDDDEEPAQRSPLEESTHCLVGSHV
jgi:site-specific DNA recombinase